MNNMYCLICGKLLGPGKYYDGCLGYEAVRVICNNCKTEFEFPFSGTEKEFEVSIRKK